MDILKSKYEIGDVVMTDDFKLSVITDVLMDGFYMLEVIDTNERLTIPSNKIKPYYKVIKTLMDDKHNIILSITNESSVKPIVSFFVEKHSLSHKKAIMKASNLIENGETQIGDSYYYIIENQLFI